MFAYLRVSPAVIALVAGLGTALTTGCDDPTRPMPPAPANGSMMVLMLLDPEDEFQPILVASVSPGLGWDELRVKLYLDGELAASVLAPKEPKRDGRSELHECSWRYAATMGFDPRCPMLQVTPRPGAEYRLEISAAGRPTASAEGKIPGDFEITSVTAAGDPPGTDGLEVHWTASDGAWRYAVGIRPESIEGCVGTAYVRECARTWYAATDSTALRTRVPQSALEGAVGPYYLEVFAIEKGLYEHLTTGAPGEYFFVPPVQNVRGGYGAVGGWCARWRSASDRVFQTSG